MTINIGDQLQEQEIEDDDAEHGRPGMERRALEACRDTPAHPHRAARLRIKPHMRHVGLDTIGGWFDVSSDGRLLIPTAVAQDATVPITVWTNWTAALKK